MRPPNVMPNGLGEASGPEALSSHGCTGCAFEPEAGQRTARTMLARIREAEPSGRTADRLRRVTIVRRSPPDARAQIPQVVGLRSLLKDFAPTIPDWANDQHTLARRKLGRDLDHFRKEGAKLIPPPTGDDPYSDEAYWL